MPNKVTPGVVASAGMTQAATHMEESGRLGNAAMNDLDGHCSAHLRAVDTTAASSPENAAEAVLSAPVDLLAFVRACPVRESARVLGLSVGTIHRLLGGYWPRDPRRILMAWSRFKGRESLRATSWFLRRVRGGMVVHAGQCFGARDLAGRDGELIAVARTPDGALIAVALDAPAARFVLVREG
jgi:hypothetical protein